MNLQEFITETLKQMIDGVVEAQTFAASKGARVNATNIRIVKEGFANIDNAYAAVQIVEFDVALTSSDSD